MTFNIASFNCKNGSIDADTGEKINLNENGLLDENKRYSKNEYICKIIEKYKIDLIALQEFYVKGLSFQDSETILEHLPSPFDKYLSNWEMCVFRRVIPESKKLRIYMEGALSGRTGSNDSGYVVMWDKSKFSYLNHSKDKLTYGNNWKLTREGWYNMKVNDEAIARPPQIVCLKPNGTNSEIELRIMNSHLRYGKSEVVVNYMHGVFPDYKSDGNSLAVKKRRSELETVLEMYNQVNSTFNGNHSIHTILMGDFNLNPPSFAMLKEFSKSKRNNSSRKEKFDLEMKQTEKTTVKSKEFEIKPLSTGMYLIYTRTPTGGWQEWRRVGE